MTAESGTPDGSAELKRLGKNYLYLIVVPSLFITIALSGTLVLVTMNLVKERLLCIGCRCFTAPGMMTNFIYIYHN
jgi:hypothetical protein